MASTVLPNGIIIPEKYSRDWYADLYHNWQELDNLLGGGTPKDGTLTIQKNGSTVGTFSANQATNETINITVPTKTSDLTNDSNFVESSDLATVATSGNYNDLSDKPTIPTVNNATLTIQRNGTTVDTFTANASVDKTININTADDTKIPLAGSSQISGSLIPSTNGTVNLGGPSYQWNNAYIKSLTINGVACGDILTHNVNEFVGVSGNQTIRGNKDFTGRIGFVPYSVRIKNDSQEIGVVPSSNQWNGINFTDKNNSQTFSIEQAFLLNGNTMLHFSMTPNIAGGSLLRIFESVYHASTAEIVTKSRTLIPDANNSRDLGTTTNKWKSFNGINPGALSLPGASVNVDTTNWVLDGSNVNIFTPASDGWLGIQGTDSVYDQMHYVFVGRIGGGGTYYQQNLAVTLNALWDSKYHGCIIIPVVKGQSYHIRCICSTIVATFYPCQGNV